MYSSLRFKRFLLGSTGSPGAVAPARLLGFQGGMDASSDQPRAPRVQAAPLLKAAPTPKKVLMMGGTRFIGLYLARQLIEEGHDVTLYTRGKSTVCPKIPDDSDESYKNFSSCASYSTRDKNLALPMCGRTPCLVLHISGHLQAALFPNKQTSITIFSFCGLNLTQLSVVPTADVRLAAPI
jgi:hypothetical protein